MRNREVSGKSRRTPCCAEYPSRSAGNRISYFVNLISYFREAAGGKASWKFSTLPIDMANFTAAAVQTTSSTDNIRADNANVFRSR